VSGHVRLVRQVHHLDEDGDYSLDVETALKHDMREEGSSQVSRGGGVQKDNLPSSPWHSLRTCAACGRWGAKCACAGEDCMAGLTCLGSF